MSKLTNELNQIWYQQEGKQIKIGLTRNFLDLMDECWHILPAHNRSIKEKAPLLTVETNDSLVSVLSPVSGNVLRWEAKATNFPDKLTENDVVLVLTAEKVEEMAIPLAVQALERARGNPLRGSTVGNNTFTFNPPSSPELAQWGRATAIDPLNEDVAAWAHPDRIREITEQLRRAGTVTTAPTTPQRLSPEQIDRQIMRDRAIAAERAVREGMPPPRPRARTTRPQDDTL